MQTASRSGELIVKQHPSAGVVFDSISRVLFVLAGVLVIFAMLAISGGVVMRYLLGMPLSWVVEATAYSLLFITFLGVTWTLKKGRHVRITVVSEKLSPRNQAILDVVVFVIGAAICLVIVWYSSLVDLGLFQSGELTGLTVLELPKGPQLVIIPVGMFFLFFYSLVELIRSLLRLIYQRDHHADCSEEESPC